MNAEGDKSQFVSSGGGLTGAGFSIPRQNLNNFTSKLGSGSETSTVVAAALYEKYDKPQERYVWEMRKRSPNTTPASTVLNSPDLIDPLGYSMQLHQHQQIRVGRSPVSLLETSNENNPPNTRTNNISGNNEIIENNIPQQMLTSAGSPTDLGTSGANLIRGGEIVVFDDIDTNWMKSNKECCMSSEDVLKVTKMIGQLPIAEYEGSPRRIGSFNQQEISPTKSFNSSNSVIIGGSSSNNNGSSRSPSTFPRPPGFPQRISPNIQQDDRNKSPNLIDMDASDDNISDKTNDNKSSLNLSVLGTSNNINKDNKDEEESIKPKTPTFDYLYEFSETRKVLEEFFKCTNNDDERKFSDLNESDDLASTDTNQDYNNRSEEKKAEQAYIGQRLARLPNEEYMVQKSPRKHKYENYTENNDIELYIDTNSRSSGDLADTELEANLRRHSRNFTLSPETTDYDSNCGDLDSLSNDINCPTDFGKLYTSMPVLEDGLSSGHASDTENNLSSAVIEKNYLEMAPVENMDTNNLRKTINDTSSSINLTNNLSSALTTNQISSVSSTVNISNTNNINSIVELTSNNCIGITNNSNNCKNIKENNFEAIFSSTLSQSTPPPPPAPAPHRHSTTTTILQSIPSSAADISESQDIQEALKDIRSALQRTKALQDATKPKYYDEVIQGGHESPIWVPRKNTQSQENLSNLSNLQLDNCKKDSSVSGNGHDEEEADTDLETDRLLGQQRSDDQDFFDEKPWLKASRLKSPTSLSGITLTTIGSATSSVATGSTNAIVKPQTFSSATIRQGIGTALTPTSPEHCHIVGSSDITLTSPEKLQFTKPSPTSSIKSKKDSLNGDKKSKSRNKEVLIEGVLFRARYLGSTQLVCEGQPTKSTRMMQAEEAVSRIKAPEGENQPSTEVDLFISTEKIMVLNTDLKEIMMDHALRTISYIADIGDLVVLMARRRFVPSETDDNVKPNRTPKMICHVFESDEAQFIAQSIGQAFQVAYMEFLKANGIEDHSFVKEMDYQEVLNSQEIFGDELEIFAKKELQKEVVVPKAKGEILGVVIVESGWGSMLPTVVIANLMSSGAAARCGQLNIGDQLIAINGMSLVGLPLSTCQTYIKNTKTQTAVKFTVVPCPPVVEVKIKRPNTKYQLGFSVQNGVICSLLRGGIAERGGVRVGHRIIEINNQSVVAVPHEKIVNLLATSVGEILMKTMPTSMFRLLTGQENPIYI
ncbi:uncharacterized protein LOC129605171 isoform X2 [Condylostylus longicornis]|uniref:uncharacterized protein LOC129605171 isoform X2 n=1 Tax=Condylostylus longicornis TaxID=2530218 RepID=UPI00244DF6B7|nr:uncharacterized protein LOC129605171 isoform X2 [Condylostylus longicornis]